MDIATIREICKQRDDLLRAEGSLTRQIKAIERRLIKTGTQERNSVSQLAAKPLFEVRETIHKEKLAIERMLKKGVRALPAYGFVTKTRGFGDLAFAIIIGAAGDLSNYSNPSKLWKRMGLAVIDGERQRKHLNIEKAEQHGFNPFRRAAMHVIGDALIKQGVEYKALYDGFKVFEQSKAPDLAPIVHHKRAMRKMEKRLLRDLWEFWNAHQSRCLPLDKFSLPDAPANAVTSEEIHVS